MCQKPTRFGEPSAGSKTGVTFLEELKHEIYIYLNDHSYAKFKDLGLSYYKFTSR